MAYASGIVTAPVSIADVKAVVPAILTRTNSSTGQTETITSSDLGVLAGAIAGDTVPSTDGKGTWTVISRVPVNMWAKFKPVRSYQSGLINTIPQLNSLNRWDESLSSQWWRDTINRLNQQIKYGISPTYRTGREDKLAELLTIYSNDWQYIRPNGGSYPYRTMDFHQYNHQSPHPIGSFSAPSSLILSNTDQVGWSIDVALFINQDDKEPITDRDYITPADILTAMWGSCYFGFALIDSQGVAKIWTTGTRYYGYGNNHSLLGEGTYTVMPFYTDTLLPQDTSQSLNPYPATIPSTTRFATIPNVECPQLVIPNGSVTTEDARFSVKAVLQNGRVNVKALVSAKPLTVQGGTVTFFGGKYPRVDIYVCKAGTTVGIGTPDPNDVLAYQTYYSQQNYLEVNSGQEAYIGGSSRGININGISADKCRVFVYAGNGNLYDTGLTPRAQGDAMVSSGEIVPEEPELIT